MEDPSEKREVQKKKPGVAAIITNGKNEFLTIHRTDRKQALPSGVGWVNFDKTEDEGVKGEIRHTLGIPVDRIHLKNKFLTQADPGSRVDEIAVFEVEVEGSEMKLREKDATATEWINFNNQEKIKKLGFEHPRLIEEYKKNKQSGKVIKF